ncbi:hypothetical protein [Methylotenera sp.]|uniref:hypothetical protein n=1 Tax=Methylotenera sp. TaxID=2051956 RepID=UPI002489CFB1|nr:hypothetical protein [Methylotenera sp.]MDI1298992.1 hypothetical protein [Methylotenera sp.]
MVNVTKTGNAKAKTSNKWLYIVLFITLVFTAWTAFHNGDEANNELEVKNASATNNQTSKYNVGQSKQDQSSLKPVENSLVNSSIPWQKLKRERLDSKPYDAFKVHSWVVVPPVKKLPPVPPPPPKAPPAPFTYVGKLENSPKGTQIFLMENNKLLSVVVGEKVNGLWKLDSEDASAIHLTFIPLDLKQVLSKSARLVVPTAIEVNQ